DVHSNQGERVVVIGELGLLIEIVIDRRGGKEVRRIITRHQPPPGGLDFDGAFTRAGNSTRQTDRFVGRTDARRNRLRSVVCIRRCGDVLSYLIRSAGQSSPRVGDRRRVRVRSRHLPYVLILTEVQPEVLVLILVNSYLK